MKKTLFSAAALAATFVFTGCYDAIFYNIRNEVPLEDGVINGYTNSIVRYQKDGKEFLYLQNGNIYYKQISVEGADKTLTENQDHDKWEKDGTAPGGLEYKYYDEKFSGTYSCILASDANYLYMLGATPVYDQDNGRNVLKNFTLYYSDGTKWEKLENVNNIIREYENTLKDTHYTMDASIQLFCTNAPQNDHRKAYIRIGGGSPYYKDISEKQNYGNFDKNENGVLNCGIIKLNGDATDVSAIIAEGTGKIGSLEKTGAGKNTLSAVYANSDIYFLDYVAASTNETKDADVDITWIYYGDGGTLRSLAVSSIGTATTETLISTSGCDDDILSLCVTKDSVILGTFEEGAYYVALTDGKPAESTTSFPDGMTNADNVMCPPYIIRMLFCTDPSIGATESGSALYSALQFRYTESVASASYKNVGLWSYYSARGNWNKE